jgi:hypothetical protein
MSNFSSERYRFVDSSTAELLSFGFPKVMSCAKIALANP